MQPINYNIDVKAPFANAMQGVEAGFGLSNAMDKAQQQQMALAQQKQMQSDLAVLAQKPDPTAQDFAAISTKYPSLAEHFKNTWSMLSADQQQSRLGQATQVYSALNANQPEIAKQLLREQITAARNAGREQDAKTAETMLGLIDSNPKVALSSAGLMLSSVLGPEKFTSTFSTLQKLPGEVQKGEAEATKAAWEAKDTPQRLELANLQTAANIRNLDSQISERSQRLGLDRDKAQSDVDLRLLELNQKGGKLDDSAIKIVNDSTVAAVTLNQSAGQMIDLADRLEKEGARSGLNARAIEWLKNTTGSQNYVSDLRNEYTRLRSKGILRNLPPGTATDKDVEFAAKGFPPDTANPQAMASFMRGMAKLQQWDSTLESAKAEWVNAVGHLGKPRQDIEVDGIKVPAGSTFTDFANQYMGALAGKQSTQSAQQAVPNRSYMRWASPQGQPAQPGQLGSGTFNFGQ